MLGRRVCCGFTLVLAAWLVPAAAQNVGPPAGGPGAGTPVPQGVTDVEYLLQLSEAERKFDQALLDARTPASTRMRPQFDPAKLNDLKQALQVLLQRIDAMIASDKVLPTRRTETRLKKLSALYEGTKIDRAAYGPQFDAYIEQLLSESRQEEGDQRSISALVTAYRMLDRFVDGAESNEAVLTALEKYVQSYPASPFGFELLLRRARNLNEIGDKAGALDVYQKAADLFRSDGRGDLVRSIVKRLEICGQPASVQGPTVDGGEFNLEDWKGKVVLVDFWASWCQPCIEAFPKLAQLYEKYHDKGLEIVGVALDDARESATETLERDRVPWPQIFFDGEAQSGFDNPIAQTYSVTFIPMYFLIDREGNFIVADYLDGAGLERAIVKALGLPGPVKSPVESAEEEPSLAPVRSDKEAP